MSENQLPSNRALIPRARTIRAYCSVNDYKLLDGDKVIAHENVVNEERTTKAKAPAQDPPTTSAEPQRTHGSTNVAINLAITQQQNQQQQQSK
ncbi:hypothetical protein ASPCAL07474 [Aspergillus calidoustus]|uniref:Uncharacterized protein n=1 Tax=Aspergillus calidoustus TaxID=454130 RepID=A0A0U5G3T4_ASPCI|nr:hypothetical protein ASPCAL07474 [Aspergillus calidoustus]